jgi:hypothetical protein
VVDVPQKTAHLGEKGCVLVVVIGLDDLARLLWDNALAFLCLFGGRSHSHSKIVVFIDVLALFSSACDRIFILVAALIIAACPAIVDGVRFLVQPSFTIVAAAFFIASMLVVLCPLFF